MNNWKKLFTVIVAIGIILIVSRSFGLAGSSNSKNTLEDNTPISQVEKVQDASISTDAEMDGVWKFISYTGFKNAKAGHFVMIFVGLFFIFLAIKYDYEPLLLIPIGFGVLIGNIPFLEDAGLQLGIYEKGSVLNYLYKGVTLGIYPPLIFL